MDFIKIEFEMNLKNIKNSKKSKKINKKIVKKKMKY